MDNSLMMLPLDFLLKKLDLCGVYEKYLGTGSIPEIVALKYGRRYPIANPFIEGERLLQIRGVQCEVASMRDVFSCEDV